MDEFKRQDPNVITPIGPAASGVHERIIIERDNSSAVWWIVGILLAAVVFGLIYFINRTPEGTMNAEMRVVQAEAAAENARQTAETAIMQNQMSNTRDSVAIAQAETATARAEAIRATADARLAEARLTAPVVVERQTVITPQSNGTAVITTTSPQP